MLGTAVAASIPVALVFSMPMRELLAMMLNGLQPAPEAGWGFIAERYPAAVVDLLRADGGFVRDGELYSAVFLLGGLLLLFALTRGTAASPLATLLKAGVVAGVAYVLVVPIFSAFRQELALVPMAAFGLGAGVEWAVARIPALSGLRIRTTIAEGPRA